MRKSPHIECGKKPPTALPYYAGSGFVSGEIFRAKSAPEGAPMRFVLMPDRNAAKPGSASRQMRKR